MYMSLFTYIDHCWYT